MDTELKKRFKAFVEQPDEELWGNIKHTLHRRARWRGVSVGVIVVLVLGMVVVSLVWRDLFEDTAGTADTVATIAPKAAAPLPSDTVAATLPVKAAAATADIPAKQPAEQKTETHAGLSTDELNTLIWSVASAQFSPDTANNTERIDTAPVQTLKVDTVVANNNVAIDHSSKTVADSHSSKFNPNSIASTETLLSIPNAMNLSDDDLRNREFRVYSREPLASFKLAIYNRGGRLIYQSSDINAAWKGTYKGEPVQQGAYAYVIFYTDAAGKTGISKGTITVLR